MIAPGYNLVRSLDHLKIKSQNLVVAILSIIGNLKIWSVEYPKKSNMKPCKLTYYKEEALFIKKVYGGSVYINYKYGRSIIFKR